MNIFVGILILIVAAAGIWAWSLEHDNPFKKKGDNDDIVNSKGDNDEKN